MLVRQLEEELRMRMRQPNIEMQQQIEALYSENEHLTREIAILRDTIKVSRLQFNFFLTTNYSQLSLYSGISRNKSYKNRKICQNLICN